MSRAAPLLQAACKGVFWCRSLIAALRGHFSRKQSTAARFCGEYLIVIWSGVSICGPSFFSRTEGAASASISITFKDALYFRARLIGYEYDSLKSFASDVCDDGLYTDRDEWTVADKEAAAGF